MLVSERLRSLYNMMEWAKLYAWESSSSLMRRFIALGIISEMQTVIEQLEALNEKLDLELSVEDADINYDLWFDNDSVRDIQNIFQSRFYIEHNENESIINKTPELISEVKSTTFKDGNAQLLKSGMRHLNSEAVIHHIDIANALKYGYEKIISLLREIKEKMTDISDELYENFCYDYMASGLDLAFQQAEREYLSWKDEHDWKTQQALEDKRTQEIVRFLSCRMLSHISVSNREIKDCFIKIQEEALEHDTVLPENIDVDCARLSKYVFMKDCIMWFDHAKLGKYLYRHYKEISFEQELALKVFSVMLDFIHHDMAKLNPKLLVSLPDYEDTKLQAVLDNAIIIINTCKQYLNEKNPDTFLESYLKTAYYGELRKELQKNLARKAVYTHICRMLGMLKSTMKVFKIGTSSENLASCVSSLTDKPKKESMIREIDAGASDMKSNLRKWTEAYVKEHCFTESERLFVGLSEKQQKPK